MADLPRRPAGPAAVDEPGPRLAKYVPGFAPACDEEWATAARFNRVDGEELSVIRAPSGSSPITPSMVRRALDED